MDFGFGEVCRGGSGNLAGELLGFQTNVDDIRDNYMPYFWREDYYLEILARVRTANA